MRTSEQEKEQSGDGEKRTQAERREKAEREMLKAAVKLITQKGLAGLKLNDVGEAAGYSRGLPAHYFGRKEELIARLGRYIVDSYITGLQRAGLDKRGAGLEGVLNPADYYLQGVESDPVTMRALLVLFTEANNNEELKSAIAELNRVSVSRFADRIRSGQSLGEIRKSINPEMQSILILGQLRGVAALWLLDPEGISMDDLRADLQSSLRRSLRA